MPKKEKLLMRGADCCLLIFDVSKEESFDSLQSWMRLFIETEQLHHKESRFGINIKNFPFILISNKSDLKRKISVHEIADFC